MKTVIIATGNAHKVEELTVAFRAQGIDVHCVPMTQVLGDVQIEETGVTFEENAYIKALTIHRLTGLPVIADDSGLEIDALDGEPGVLSARYSGEGATDSRNRDAVRRSLTSRGATNSSARFRCVLCYMDAMRTLFGIGTSEGTIGMEERGEHGFGYDPMFTPLDSNRTYAEHSQEEKLSISHRGAAVKDLSRHLVALDEDAGHASIDDPLPTTDALIMASVSAVTGNVEQLRSTIRHFVRDMNDAVLLHEALLQSYLFAGFPVALEALAVADEECRSILGTLTWKNADDFDVQAFKERGEQLCKRVYGSVYERMMERLGTITPELSSWMIVEGYGKTLSRPELDIVRRELCIVGILAALERENQLRSHVRGAFLVGANAADLRACADVVTEMCGRRQGESILRLVLLQEAAPLDR
ncbi:MAG: RdgB/HAM1 family non-canonical purine NTP pyrophosphatase [Ignavibacteria bacterium]|nr:RdgB/HAM1 family non-canonical purine NTP pyrophosphatase [Ignavibacteria bacterium]MBP6510291.1 RdgB/HAM1 family non-canonical purine NTP pyrophosphatase [Candidatus Kapabacteria bacterium]MBK6418257.1 RdgB/HAM1 family non-canonical purine NTP pyrophosphatase [Ignavibacteria bacterium]MBK6761198.1 RdgB/HAM1 family non-canonical purine NTP pyrophosphatase [Ignavibacteria bacterium]MBK7185744.1 RdgB/HAM1 family non-canonical purine NTP pyrophosphatase [Ignavibacteria bacterium]